MSNSGKPTPHIEQLQRPEVLPFMDADLQFIDFHPDVDPKTFLCNLSFAFDEGSATISEPQLVAYEKRFATGLSHLI
jgi:hypothetical protein